MPGQHFDSNGGENQNPSSTTQLLLFVTVAFALIAVTFFFSSLLTGNIGDFSAYIAPCLVLLCGLLAMRLLFPKSRTGLHGNVQALILVITVASFYAFGWPRKLEFQELRHAFSELCVILVLFLLAELAAYLTLAAQRITSDLEKTEVKVTGSFESAARTAVTGVKVNTDPIREQLQELLEKLNAGNIGDAVKTLAGISYVGEAVTKLEDAGTRGFVLKEVSNYARAWAVFLQSTHNKTEPAGGLRFECARRFFKTYLNREIQDMGWQEGRHTPQPIRMATDDELYFDTLREMLLAFDAAKVDFFAWAITNIPPVGYYHWGEEFGNLGAHSFSDEFRQMVRKLVLDKREYHRLFLLHNIPGEDSDPRTAGVALKKASTIEETSNKLLLFVDENGQSDVTDEMPRDIQTWRDLEVLDKIIGDEPASRVSGGNLYGIVDASDSLWKADAQPEIVQKRGVVGTYKVRAVRLLAHFKKTYQSEYLEDGKDERGMFFWAIQDSKQLDPLPAPNPDWLILGTKSGTEYNPIIAISANVSLTSKTMRMEVFTASEDLAKIKRFWEKTKSVRETTNKFLASVARAK